MTLDVHAWGDPATKERVKSRKKTCAGRVRGLCHECHRNGLLRRGGWIKLNSDAGYRQDTGDARTGVIIRDSLGNVLLSAWKSLRHAASIDERRPKPVCMGSTSLLNGYVSQSWWKRTLPGWFMLW
jgi:hypothetical protein